jgi:hypothetical protein
MGAKRKKEEEKKITVTHKAKSSTSVNASTIELNSVRLND